MIFLKMFCPSTKVSFNSTAFWYTGTPAGQVFFLIVLASRRQQPSLKDAVLLLKLIRIINILLRVNVRKVDFVKETFLGPENSRRNLD